MSYEFKIAWRYFFSKSKQTVVNRINRFALIMVVVTTTSLFVVLSAFSGLKEFGLSFSNIFDPDFEILPEEGSYLNITEETILKLESIPEIIAVAPEIERKVYLSFKDKSQIAILKAVSEKYTSVLNIDSLVSLGDWLSFKGPEAVVGFGIAGTLSLGIYDYNNFLNITVPRTGLKGQLNQNFFKTFPTIVSGLYQINEDLDKKYMFSNLKFGQNLFNLESSEYSSIVLKVVPGTKKKILEKQIKSNLDKPFNLISRAEQNKALYRMLNTENLGVYLIFSLVMIIGLFNVIGSLTMMILDKKRQIKILYALGATQKGIHNIFMIIGILICGIGGTIGLIIGISIILFQSNYPFILVPGTNIEYPVIFELKNVLIVVATLMFFGAISTAWALKGLSKKIN
ncbi:ABC transporter permease [Bacteroidetes bacterium SCGC AAA795-G10]|nr:ABC transporter permease [Bacteroidetes bacterium SCGC AAA795-G10]